MAHGILGLAGALAIGYWIMMKAANEKGKVKLVIIFYLWWTFLWTPWPKGSILRPWFF